MLDVDQETLDGTLGHTSHGIFMLTGFLTAWQVCFKDERERERACAPSSSHVPSDLDSREQKMHHVSMGNHVVLEGLVGTDATVTNSEIGALDLCA